MAVSVFRKGNDEKYKVDFVGAVSVECDIIIHKKVIVEKRQKPGIKIVQIM